METKWKLPTTASFFLALFFSKRERFKQSDAHLFIEIPGTERRNTPDKGQRNPPPPPLIVSRETLAVQIKSFPK